MPKRFYRTLLQTFATGFPHHSIWLCNQSTLLVGSMTPHLPSASQLRQRLNTMPYSARVDLHQAGVPSSADLAAAHVGTWRPLPEVEVLCDDRPFLMRIGYWSAQQRLGFLPQNLAELQPSCEASDWPDKAWAKLRSNRLSGLQNLAAARLPGPSFELLSVAARRMVTARFLAPGSVLLHAEEGRVLQALAERRAWQALGGSQLKPGAHLRLSGAMRRDLTSALRRFPDSALLYALQALAQSDADQRGQWARSSHALDPTLLPIAQSRRPNTPLRELRGFVAQPDGSLVEGPLEHLAQLPAGEALIAAASAPGPLGFALRHKFKVQVGYALLAQLAIRPLNRVENELFRQVMDPLLLKYAVRQLGKRPRTTLREFLPLWRRELALPRGFPALADLLSTPALRQELAEALRGRRGAGAKRILADLLIDQDLKVRRAAAVSLSLSFGDLIEFDALWPESRRRRAAEQLRAMHNR